MNMKLFSDTKILADGQPLSVILAAADLARDLKRPAAFHPGKERGRGRRESARASACERETKNRNATVSLWRERN